MLCMERVKIEKLIAFKGEIVSFVSIFIRL
nr:MAG TPA: hypothetical protein [Bacteriophage sp.]